MHDEPLKVKVVNHLTGEISEKEITGGDQAVQVYMELKASYKALEGAMGQILQFIDVWMGQDDQMMIGGHQVKRQQRETKTWTKEGLLAVGIDRDALDVALKVSMPIAKELVKESIERGDIKPTAMKELDQSADVQVSKPFLVLK